MFLIINSISQTHLENQVTLLLGCVFSAISARINSHKTFQSAAFFFFFFEPKCHSKLFMTTSLVVRVLPFAMNRRGAKVWALLEGGHTVRHESWGQNAEKGLKETLLEAFPFLFRQSSETKIMVLLLVPDDFQLPQENKDFQFVVRQRLTISNAGTKWLSRDSWHRQTANSLLGL